jgi:hypothetical protein
MMIPVIMIDYNKQLLEMKSLLLYILFAVQQIITEREKKNEREKNLTRS